MKKIILLFVALSIFSCKENDSFLPLPNLGDLLTSIEYTGDDRSWVEDYFYDIEERLIRVDDLRSLGRRYDLIYERERLAEVITHRISDDLLIFRDELEYDEQGRLIKTLNYSINGGETVPLARTNEYTYNEAGAIIQKTTYSANSNIPGQIEKYFWENGNVIRTEHHEDNDDNLSYTFAYEYDQSFNYNRYQTHKTYDFSVWNQNNITRTTLTKDCTGLIDLYCNPCTSYFTYDAANYPIEVEGPNNTFKLIYK